MKRFLVFGLIFFLAAVNFFNQFSLYPPLGSVKISFFSVGQGDAILIVTGDKKTLLIDGGPDKSILSEINSALPWWHRHLDFVLLTHEHDDHLLGLIELGGRYHFTQVMYGAASEENNFIKEWFADLKKDKIKKYQVKASDSFSLGKYCRVNILSAAVSREVNDQSLVSELVCGERKFLFMGDAGEAIENILIDEGLGAYDLLKVGHHGSLTASQEKFLKIVRPTIAVISVGKNNKFFHPRPEVLTRLQKTAGDILRTDELGTINIIANNKEIYLRRGP